MSNRPVEAAGLFGKVMCASAIFSTYKDLLGLSQQEAVDKGFPMSGGRMGTCGAVLACQTILETFKPEKVPELEERFSKLNGSSQCAVLKGRTGGPILRACPGCIEDAARIMEELMEEDDEKNC